MNLLRALLLAALLAPAPRAQTAGQVLWTVDLQGYATMSQPRVAPDGTIYIVTNRLYAIAPDGTVKWTAAASESYVDIGPDGTVYTAGGNTVYAYRPDGSLRWRFTESPAGQGIMQGPTIGPDGNLYVVSDLGGLGAFSLTPQGQLRWSVPGFSNNAGTGLGRVQFGPNNMYYAERRAPGCGPLTTGMVSITLNGHLDWCIPISGVSRPWATLDGKAITWQGQMSGKTLFAYNPSGSIVWTHTFDFSPVAIGSVVTGPDNNLYVFHNTSTLASLTANGAVRWERSQPINNFPWQAAVAPDLSAVVSGSVYGFGVNGTIIAANPANGNTLWSVPVTGPSAGAGAPAEFSPDGAVVYVPVNTLDFAVPDQLWAIRVRDAASQPIALTAAPTSPPVVIPAGGGRFSYRVTLTNQTSQPQTFQVWTAITGPASRNPALAPQSVTLPAGATVSRTLTQQIPGNAPAGTYTYTVNAGTFPGTVLASASFSFTKQAGGQAPAGSGVDWRASGWDEAPAASASAALPGGFALSEAAPNPFANAARFTLEVEEAQHVTAAAFDALGRCVAVLHDGQLEAGAHALTFDAASLPPGLYVVRVTGETFATTRRATLVR